MKSSARSRSLRIIIIFYFFLQVSLIILAITIIILYCFDIIVKIYKLKQTFLSTGPRNDRTEWL